MDLGRSGKQAIDNGKRIGNVEPTPFFDDDEIDRQDPLRLFVQYPAPKFLAAIEKARRSVRF